MSYPKSWTRADRARADAIIARSMARVEQERRLRALTATTKPRALSPNDLRIVRRLIAKGEVARQARLTREASRRA